MEWQPDEKTREMDRLYRRCLLVILSSVCIVVIVACFYPRDQEREPVKSALLFAFACGSSLSVVFWSRSKVKKSGISGQELYAYFMTKPLMKIVHVIILVSIIVAIYHAIKK
jgi:hypothetical protein